VLVATHSLPTKLALPCPPACHLPCRKKERTEQLKGELAALQAENAALQSLLLEMHTTGEAATAEAGVEWGG